MRKIIYLRSGEMNRGGGQEIETAMLDHQVIDAALLEIPLKKKSKRRGKKKTKNSG